MEGEADGRVVGRFGFRTIATAEPRELVAALGDRLPTDALLAWLEEGLGERRFSPEDVRDAFAGLRLIDDEGVARAPGQLARAEARALFGARRADWPAGNATPRLARALGVPARPDARMIVDFLVELGDEPSGERADEDALCARVPACLERLAQIAPDEVLPPNAVVAVRLGDRVTLLRVDDPRVRTWGPPPLAAALEAVALDASTLDVAEPLPLARDPAIARLLARSGVPDLGERARLERVTPGPRPSPRVAAALDARAAALFARLAPHLPRLAPDRPIDALVVHESLALEVTLELGAGPRLALEADAAIDGRVLRATAIALEEPARLADALSDDAARREALGAWLRSIDDVDEAPTPPAPPPRRIASGEGLMARVRRFFRGARDDAGDARGEARAQGSDARTSREAAGPRSKPPPSASTVGSGRSRTSGVERSSAGDEAFFRARERLEGQLETTEGWVERRREVPTYGFAFTPERLAPPWAYAPNLVGVRFDRRTQRWLPAPLDVPAARGEAGVLALRGRLPAGRSLLPIPHYGALDTIVVDHDEGPSALSFGRRDPRLRVEGPLTSVHLAESSDVTLRVTLGPAPALDGLTAGATPAAALERTVPDDELPDEVHDFLGALEDDAASALERARRVRDFVRARYRYDPTYLEDASVGRWLARATRGRANVHVAALHAGRDGRHLGAGVCYELNALACELMRRAGVPAALATGWVMDGGHLSEPDHLWALALLEDAHGAPAWIPIDASTTRDGRPLRVARRPPGRFRAPRDRSASAPRGWSGDAGDPAEDRAGRRGTPARQEGGERRGAGQRRRAEAPTKVDRSQRRPPRVELSRVLHHLAHLSGEPLDDAERRAILEALDDPRAAKAMLERLRRR